MEPQVRADTHTYAYVRVCRYIQTDTGRHAMEISIGQQVRGCWVSSGASEIARHTHTSTHTHTVSSSNK